MTDRIKATYENGVFKPASPVQLPEGSIVDIEVIGADAPSAAPDPRVAAEILARIAVLPAEGDTDDPYVSENHDHYLYGAEKRRT